MRRRASLLLALALVASVFAGVLGTASAEHDENAPEIGHAFLPWVPNGSELSDGQGPFTGAVTVQNLEDEDAEVDVYVGAGEDSDGGWTLEETVTLAAKESITLSADELEIPEPGASVVLEGFLQREETDDDDEVTQEAIAARIAAVTKNASPTAATGGTTSAHEVVDGYSALTAEDVVQDLVEGMGTGDGTYVLPVVQTNSGWETSIRVANLSASGGLRNVTVTLYGSATQGYAGESQVVNLQLRAGENASIDLSDHVEEGWVGSAFITSGADIGAVAERSKAVDDMLISNVSRPEQPWMETNSVKYGALVFKEYNYWNTGISVANTDPNNDNHVVITYYGPTMNQVGQDTLTIPPRGQEYVYTPGTQDLGLTDGFVGSVKIEGSTELHAVIDQVKYFGNDPDQGQAMSYTAEGDLAEAGQSLALPLAQKGNPVSGSGDTSGIQLFNPTDASATVDIVFYGANGLPVAPTVQNNQADPLTVTLGANQSYTLYTHAQGELSSGFHGSVEVDVVGGNGAVVGVSNNVNYDVQNDGSTAFSLVRTEPRQAATLTLTPDTATNTVGEDHTVTANLRDQFDAPISGETIDFSVSSTGTPSETGDSVVTDANGNATFTYTNTTVGTDTITADHSASGLSDTASKTWEPDEPASVTLTAVPTTQSVDSTVELTALVEDQYNNPVPGVDVAFESDQQGALTTVQTDANGEAIIPAHNHTIAETEVVTATEQVNLNADTATITWTAGVATSFSGTTTANPTTLSAADIGSGTNNTSTITTQVTAEDQYGNPTTVPADTTVSWTVTTTGSAAGTVSPTSEDVGTTTPNDEASTTLTVTAGADGESVTVTATIEGDAGGSATVTIGP